MNDKPSSNPGKDIPLQLPYRPHVAAGWKIPGVGAYKINQWLKQARDVNGWEENRKALSDPRCRVDASAVRRVGT